MDFINKAIFSTNQFATGAPDLHRKIWAEFEKAVPASKRNAFYGADSVEYIKYLNLNHLDELRKFDSSIGGIIVK